MIYTITHNSEIYRGSAGPCVSTDELDVEDEVEALNLYLSAFTSEFGNSFKVLKVDKEEGLKLIWERIALTQSSVEMKHLLEMTRNGR